MIQIGNAYDDVIRPATLIMRPNVLRVSCAAQIDRDNHQAEICFQNAHDLARRVAASATRACWAAGLLDR